MHALFSWTDLGLNSNLTFVAVQFTFLLILSFFRIRRLIATRIGGIDVIVIKSWGRLICGVLLCNAIFLLMHHLYLSFGPSTESMKAFISFHFLMFTILGLTIIPLLGILFDGGKAIHVRTDRFKPEHSPLLIDMTRHNGRYAQLIPRGAIFAYQFLMFFTWIAINPR